MENIFIILAGGLGKRMNSDLPKVLHLLDNKPLLVHVLETAINIKPDKILIVVGKYGEIIKKTLNDYVSIDNFNFIDQINPLGTGHAIQCCAEFLSFYKNSIVTILSGDVPLISSKTILNLIKEKENNDGIILVNYMNNPSGYGRIKQDSNKKFVKIIEHKDCLEDELKIKLVNTGIYVFNCESLLENLYKLDNNNSQKEYYLTDIFKFMNIDKISLLLNKNNIETTGINTIDQLNDLKIYCKETSIRSGQ